MQPEESEVGVSQSPPHSALARSARERVGVGVIGVGIMGRRHAENAAWRIAESRLVAVVDASEQVARGVAAEFDALACRTLDELLARDDVRAVVVASPAQYHAEQAIAAARAGKDVLVEKPLAHSLEECDRIIQAAERAKVRLQVGFMRRYDPAYAEAHRLIASGALGEPLLYKAVHRDREPADLAADVGVSHLLLESAVHDFDLARWLMSDEIARVGTTARALCHERGEHGHAPNGALNALEFTRGGLGDVETYRGARYAYDVRTEVVCARGTAMVGHPQRTGLEVFTAEGARHDLVPGFLERFAVAYLLELGDFVRGTRERRSPAISGRDGRAAVAVALAARAAYASGRAEPVAS